MMAYQIKSDDGIPKLFTYLSYIGKKLSRQILILNAYRVIDTDGTFKAWAAARVLERFMGDLMSRRITLQLSHSHEHFSGK